MALIVQTCGVVGTLIAATIAVRSYVGSNKRAQETRDRELETRQAQLFMAIFDKFSSPEITKLYAEMESYRIEDITYLKDTYYSPIGPGRFQPIWEIWESVGVLVHEDLLEIRIVARCYGNMYRMTWEKWGPHIIKLRSEWGFPRLMIESEYLYDRLMEFGRKYPEYQIIEATR